MANLNIFCVIEGETTSFPVEIESTKTVGHLKDAIKAKKSNYFEKIDADGLTLWRVDIPDEDKVLMKDKVRPEEKEVTTKDKVVLTEGMDIVRSADGSTYSTRLLSPSSMTLSDGDAFGAGSLKGRTIYVIVQLPQPVKRRREYEAEAPQKLLKVLGATSIADTRIFQTISEDSAMEQSEQAILPRNLPNFINWRAVAGTIFADKTPFIEALEEMSPNYRFVFLRPRRFGKSAFLNMLTVYYDIHAADMFDDLFGPLYIGNKPTESKNQLLVLKFNLSSVDISRSSDNIATSFNLVINDVLRRFLQEYCKELGSPEEESIIDDTSASRSLTRVMSLVGEQSQSLFVGVDEYDAPANNAAFTGGDVGSPDMDKVRWIETFFNCNFFTILKQGCEDTSKGRSGVVIEKYFLTGVTPAFRAGISPLTATSIVSHIRGLHGICGFTEEEVKALTKHYLAKDDQAVVPILHALKRLYNGYCFWTSGGDESEMDQTRLYSPHLVFHYLSNFKTEGFVAKPEESTAVHTTTILRSISDIGEFSVSDLMEIVVTGSVKTSIKAEFGYSDLQNVGKDREYTWSLLFYLGILTLGTNGSLRIPNDVIKLDVFGRIMDFLRTQDKFSSLMIPSMTNLKAGSAGDFRSLLERLLQSRATRSAQTANEAVLQGIVEVLLNSPSSTVPELCLVIDGTKRSGQGRFGYVDVFVPKCSGAKDSDQTCIAMELKNVHLYGLFRATSTTNPTHSDYEALREAIITENDATLLAREYKFRSESEATLKTTTLESIMESGKTQLRRYMETIALGKPKTLSASGVIDNRIVIDHGLDDIKGYVIMAIGGARVLVHSMEVIDTTNSYVKALKL